MRKLREMIEEGHVTTWVFDKDGDMTHSAAQWSGKAWIHPQIKPGFLILSIISSRTRPLTNVVYGVYMGRLAECFITHLSQYITSLRITARPSEEHDFFKSYVELK